MSLLNDLASFIYEGLDEQELISKLQDPSEVHVNQPVKVKKQPSPAMKKYKKKKREIDIGLANNAFGAAAGLAGTKLAWDQAKTIKPDTMKTAPEVKTSKVGLALKKLKVPPKAAAVGAGSAIVGAQLVNGAMDAQSAQYFARERSKLKKPKEHVKKACDEIVEKRRNGEITTEEAIDLIEKAVKLVPTDPVKLNKYGQRTIMGTAAGTTGVVGYIEGDKKLGKAKADRYAQKYRAEPVQKAIIDPAKYEFDGEVRKSDTEKRQVFGWCSLSKVDGVDVVDRQGDYVPIDEMEKSAYHYVVNSRKGSDMHQRVGDQPLHTSDLIESFVVTPEKLEAMGLEPDAVPHGWWVGFKVNDEQQWENVKKGDRVHFSIHGKGRREPRASL